MAENFDDDADWDQRSMRFENRRWLEVIPLTILGAVTLGLIWVVFVIAVYDRIPSGIRYKWLADLPAFVRAAFYMPPMIAASSITWWWARTRVFRPQYVELSKDALTVSYLNEGKPIPWNRISRIVPRMNGIDIVAPGFRLSRFEFGQARIATAMIKGRRKDLEDALARYWSRNA